MNRLKKQFEDIIDMDYRCTFKNEHINLYPKSNYNHNITKAMSSLGQRYIQCDGTDYGTPLNIAYYQSPYEDVYKANLPWMSWLEIDYVFNHQNDVIDRMFR